jgi:hypothetical protein
LDSTLRRRSDLFVSRSLHDTPAVDHYSVRMRPVDAAGFWTLTSASGKPTNAETFAGGWNYVTPSRSWCYAFRRPSLLLARQETLNRLAPSGVARLPHRVKSRRSVQSPHSLHPNRSGAHFADLIAATIPSHFRYMRRQLIERFCPASASAGTQLSDPHVPRICIVCRQGFPFAFARGRPKSRQGKSNHCIPAGRRQRPRVNSTWR